MVVVKGPYLLSPPAPLYYNGASGFPAVAEERSAGPSRSWRHCIAGFGRRSIKRYKFSIESLEISRSVWSYHQISATLAVAAEFARVERVCPLSQEV